jgi:hypothetical protein
MTNHRFPMTGKTFFFLGVSQSFHPSTIYGLRSSVIGRRRSTSVIGQREGEDGETQY